MDGLPRLVTGAEAKVRSERRRIDDFSGIENTLRIERALDGAKGFVEYRAEHFLVERTANETIAVLARESAAVFKDKVRHCIRDGFELPHASLSFEVHDRANMKAPYRCMCVEAGGRIVTPQDIHEPLNVVPQFLR